MPRAKLALLKVIQLLRPNRSSFALDVLVDVRLPPGFALDGGCRVNNRCRIDDGAAASARDARLSL